MYFPYSLKFYNYYDYLLPTFKDMKLKKLQNYNFNEYIEMLMESLSSKNIRDIICLLVTFMDYLFQYCQKLKTIYVSDKWNNAKVTRSEGMFQGCSSLGGAISFDSTKITVNYANCDTGYFTYKAIE